MIFVPPRSMPMKRFLSAAGSLPMPNSFVRAKACAWAPVSGEACRFCGRQILAGGTLTCQGSWPLFFMPSYEVVVEVATLGVEANQKPTFQT
jgi:hypothetical protein